MRISNINRGVKGSRTAQEYAIRFAYMISEEAKKRAKIISFWKTYGLAATEEAYGVKKRTLYLWQWKLRESGGKLESLNCGSRAPKKKRQRRYDWRIVDELGRLRLLYPNLGEKKLYPLLVEFCAQLRLPCPKPATIGRIIADKGGMRTAPLRTTGKGKILSYKRRKVLRKPHDLAAEHPGHVVALDTVERFVHGLRRYVITCEDINSRFCFAWGTVSHASKAAEEFFGMWQQVFPYATTFVLTDNGSEFKKLFAERLLQLQITHYHTYPKTPKMNAHIERFNRTIQDEFIDYHDALLLDLPRFNEKLMDWLLFYNTKRVHHAFRTTLSPLQYLIQYEKLPAECKTTCGHTSFCSRAYFLLYSCSMKDSPDEEVNFEPEDELGDLGAAQAKLKKLKDELAKVKAERQEYLDGWQRCKADSINTRKETLATAERMGVRAKETLIEEIIPVLDGFDVAAGSPAWESLDAQWRSGIEQIRDQLLDILSRNSVERFGKVGDAFDPTIHEAVQELNDVAGSAGEIVRIMRSGYRTDDRVIRPAHVIIKA